MSENSSARISRDKARGRPFGADNPGRPFEPGNPGRPKGGRNKSTTVLRSLFEGEADEIGRKAVELAKGGKMTAIRYVLDHAYPNRKGPPVETLVLPAVTTLEDAMMAMRAVMNAVAAGQLTPEEGRDFSAMVDAFRKTCEAVDIERRLTRLERDIAAEKSRPRAAN